MQLSTWHDPGQKRWLHPCYWLSVCLPGSGIPCWHQKPQRKWSSNRNLVMVSILLSFLCLQQYKILQWMCKWWMEVLKGNHLGQEEFHQFSKHQCSLWWTTRHGIYRMQTRPAKNMPGVQQYIFLSREHYYNFTNATGRYHRDKPSADNILQSWMCLQRRTYFRHDFKDMRWGE